jgi:hypothetical protein
MKRIPIWAETRSEHANSPDTNGPKVQVSYFEPVNQLEQMLMDAGYDPAARSLFEKYLLEQNLYLAIWDNELPSGKLDNDQNENLPILFLTGDDGKDYPAVFTSELRAQECFGPDIVMAMLLGRDLLEMLSASGAWINPASAYGVFWRNLDILRILGDLGPEDLA